MVLKLKRGNTRRGSKNNKLQEEDKTRTWFHALQYYDPLYNDGWADEEISRDWGILYKLKKELEEEIPELKFRIVLRSTYHTWREVEDAFER